MGGHLSVERAKGAELEEALAGNDDKCSPFVGQVDELDFERSDKAKEEGKKEGEDTPFRRGRRT